MTHSLNVVFPDIVPKYNRSGKTEEASAKKKKPKKTANEQRFSLTSLAFFFFGAAVAQIIVLVVTWFTMFVSRGRIELGKNSEGFHC